jgi:signal transduction histidine kinase
LAGNRIERAPRGLGRLFGDLKIRPKLIVLHNAFFLILALAVYFSLIPLIEELVRGARLRENSLLVQLFSDDRPMPRSPGTEFYEFREGTAEALAAPAEVRAWLDENPGLMWQDRAASEYLYRKVNGQYRRARVPDRFYDAFVRRAQRTLFVVLGAIYVLAVLTLEFLIMPQYVYRPIKMIMRADSATQRDDRAGELIPEADILEDEIGQIMRSRNATVAELRHKNELLEAAKKNLEDQDRLASIGMLSAGVAHEMNTPLTVLHGSIEKLMETATDGHTRDRLARMKRVTERLRTISDSLVDFARTRKQVVEPVNVHALIDEAWSLLAIDDKASGVRFENRTAADHAVTGNYDRLIQVFVNLLRNALNAVSAGGHIHVTSETAGAWLAIAVEDDGPGIPPHVLPDIFDAFVTTRLDSKGTGLGLTVSEGIVRQHGGSISASNCAGGGARLEVRLPAAQQEATANAGS